MENFIKTQEILVVDYQILTDEQKAIFCFIDKECQPADTASREICLIKVKCLKNFFENPTDFNIRGEFFDIMDIARLYASIQNLLDSNKYEYLLLQN